MNGSLIVWLFDIRVRIMGILLTLYSSLFCLLCYPQSLEKFSHTQEVLSETFSALKYYTQLGPTAQR